MSLCDMPPHRKIWMTDLALALMGPATSGLAAGGALVAPITLPPANNNPAVLNKPTRTASRRDIGKLRLMPIKLEVWLVLIMSC